MKKQKSHEQAIQLLLLLLLHDRLIYF